MKPDRQLQAEVEFELRSALAVLDESIAVSAQDGVVQLEGETSSYAEKWTAERAAQRVAKAKPIVSSLKVGAKSTQARTDAEIVRLATHALDWSTLVPRKTQVKVVAGRVTLLGSADWQYERKEAERVVRRLSGIMGVINRITLRPRRTQAEVRHVFSRPVCGHRIEPAGPSQHDGKGNPRARLPDQSQT